MINCLLSVQHLFPESDLLNQAISATILMILLFLHVYFPILDNFNPVAYAALGSLVSHQSHLGLTIIFRLIVILLINYVLFVLSLKSSQ